MKIIKTIFDDEQLEQVHRQIFKLVNIEDKVVKHHIFIFLMNFKRVGNTLDVREWISNSIVNHLKHTSYHINESESDIKIKIVKYLEELLY